MPFLAASDPADHIRDIYLIGPITMHTVTLVVVGAIFIWAMMRAADRVAIGPESEGNDRYFTRGRFAQLVEVITIYMRDQMLIPVMGAKSARRYLPYLLTLFFFLAFINVFGLIPLLDLQHLIGGLWGDPHFAIIGGTATSSITVTAALAIVAGFVIVIHGLKDLGPKGFFEHMCGGLWPMPHIALLPVLLMVFVIEVAGLFIKPTALAIRLFANMVAGHILLAVLLSFGGAAAGAGAGFLGVFGVAVISGVGALAITFLEIFVALLQAFIFMFLTAVFIALLSHHDDHEHEHEDVHAHGTEEMAEAAEAPEVATA